MFFVTEKSKFDIDQNVDKFGDSFARDVSLEELRKVRHHHSSEPQIKDSHLTKSKIAESMPNKSEPKSTTMNFRSELQEHEHDLGQLPGWMFEGLLLLVVRPDHAEFYNQSSPAISKALELRINRACIIARFAGADLTVDLNDEDITHVVVEENTNTRAVRRKISRYIFFARKVGSSYD